MEKTRKYIHICEVCGRREILTPEEGYEKGWDYPPLSSSFNSVMPRKCGNCSITETLYWAMYVEGKTAAELPLKHLITLYRITQEPECITVGDSHIRDQNHRNFEAERRKTNGH